MTNGYFQTIYQGFAGTIKGLIVTFKHMIKPSITVNYPLAKLKPYERFRGALLFDAVTCIGCNLCVKACPSKCIGLENQKSPEGKTLKGVNWYYIDFGKCNFCRLCEESCPTKPKSVWHSLDYETVFFSRQEMTRCWKPGDPWIGTYWEPGEKTYKLPAGGQIPIEEIPSRR
ncbi:MAG: NADH-quinone oxidoreductase subunit I [Elusimicrobia bacterium]|nr:NADH-quinone oxidoreductase subunit I [Elusimicrobiota bacterium]